MTMKLGLFERTHPLIEDKGVNGLVNAHCLVVGVGGVGGYVTEALARAGVGRLTIVDHDVVTVSNKNRQVIALDSRVGKSKVQEFSERITDINSRCEVTVIDAFLLEDDVDDLLTGDYDYVIDAIDTVSTKIKLLEMSVKKGFKTLSSMGAGGKLDPTKILLADIFDTESCGLAAKCRTELKKRGIRRGSIIACFSSEISKKPLSPWPSLTGGRPRAVNGTISYIPSAFGLQLAGAVIFHISTGKFPLSPPTPAAISKKKQEQAKKRKLKEAELKMKNEKKRQKEEEE
eukprot:TRINITY_DN9502_c0_g1_i1.p1 TRINITY_DN9502_c0_g1~~TRINITY_DN9502_c0_g1_i1.p1  ORF type:complete len:288 (+),score=73.17 TRINITY_DN9502_c0_g1_i1:73-936(+)